MIRRLTRIAVPAVLALLGTLGRTGAAEPVSPPARRTTIPASPPAQSPPATQAQPAPAATPTSAPRAAAASGASVTGASEEVAASSAGADAALLEFLGSVDSDDQSWKAYLASTGTQAGTADDAARTACQSTPAAASSTGAGQAQAVPHGASSAHSPNPSEATCPQDPDAQGREGGR